MKKIKSFILTLIAVIMPTLSMQATPVFAMESVEEYITECSNSDAIYIGSFDFGDGLSCDVYEIPSLSLMASGTVSKTYDFELKYLGTHFATHVQSTSWSYDGVNRPTLLTSYDVFQSTDLTKHYGVGMGSTTSDYSTSSKQYSKKVEVYYNNSYLATTTFATICDKNGNLSYTCTDD